MRGWLSIAAVGAALLVSPCLWSQMRGGSRAVAAAPRSAVAGRGAVVAGAPMVAHIGGFSVTSPFIRGGFVVHGGFREPFLFDHGFRHHRFFFGNSGWPYTYGYYPGYPFWGDMYYDNTSTAYSQQQNYALQQEVMGLNDEVARLREQQAEWISAPPPPAPPPPARPAAQSQTAPSIPTTLVFKDGRTQQVQNYAISGHTIWILNEQRARKVPLSELNIAATTKANEERGVSFDLPASR